MATKKKRIYRDYRPGHNGEFTTEEAYNRSRAQGVVCNIHAEYVEIGKPQTIDSVEDLFAYDDFTGPMEDEEVHGNADYGRRNVKR